MTRFDHRFAYALFIISGATSLVYEVTWFRNLSLIFGASFAATSIVLASFMGGMSLGGFSFGRLSKHIERPLRAYGLLEIGVALFALVLPSLLQGVDAFYVSVATGDGDPGTGLLVLRATLAFAILAFPTFLMGATLPVITRLLVSDGDHFGSRLSWLYGSNTFGAVVGTLLAGFILIPALGVWHTQLVAVALNLAIGIAAIVIDLRIPPLVDADRDDDGASFAPDFDEGERIALQLVFWGTALSGFASLSLEVLWTRAIAIAAGSSTYSFTVMLAAFLMGIALGSWLHALTATRKISLAVRFGSVLLLAGFFALAASSALPKLPELAIALNVALFDDLTRIRPLTTFLLAFLMMFIPCLFIGMAFPLANQARASLAAGYSQPVGDTVSLNTLGSIGGSLVAGFVLLPWLGMQRAMYFAGGLYVAYGAVVLAVALGRRAPRAPVVALTAVVVLGALALPLMVPRSSTVMLGAFSNNQLLQYVGDDGEIDVADVLAKGALRYYREGRGATVSVLEQDAYRSLSVNGKIVASDDPEDLRTQYMLAHVPILMHAAPRSALVIGMGAGTTLGGITAHEELESIALAEIEPAILGAEPHFAAANGLPLSDPRLRVYLEDGRNFLKTTSRRFDVITADPIHPWTRGSGYLYTEEYYRLAASRLEVGGVMCQWLPVADLTPEDFKSVVATFAKVYRHTMLWHSTSAVLIGSDEPFETTVEELATRLAQPRVKGQLEPLGIADPFAFLGELQLDDAQVREFAGDALINTDDNLHLEFSSPLAVGGDRSVWTVLEEMHGFPPGESPLPEGDSNASRVAAVQRAKTLTAFGTIGLRSPEPEKQLRAVREMNTIVAKFPNYRPAAMVLSEFLAHRSAYLLEAGRAPFALADAERAIRLDPGSGAAHRALATVRRSLKQLTEAIGSFEKATALDPRNWRNHLGLAETLMELGRVEDARVAVVAGLEVHPFNEELRALMRESDES